MAAPAISIRNLDHLGLVAALCQELGIARMIDALLPKTPPFKVSHGEALVAMIVNGLGFHSSTLHMFPQFFANKPVERLIGPGSVLMTSMMMCSVAVSMPSLRPMSAPCIR